jgi:hypothetical protein
MIGTNPNLLPQANVISLAEAQGRPIVSADGADSQGLLGLLPFLDNCRETRIQTLSRSGLLADLFPNDDQAAPARPRPANAALPCLALIVVQDPTSSTRADGSQPNLGSRGSQGRHLQTIPMGN